MPPTIRPFTTPGPGYTPAAARVASNAVDVADSYFYPEVLTVTVGTTVRWTHRGNTGHDVTSLDGRWGIALLPLGSDYEHTFTQPGVYDYFCYLHRPEMVGRVVVVR